MSASSAAVQVIEPSFGNNEMIVLLHALTALKKGQAGVRLPSEWIGVAGKVADAFNEVVELNERMAGELGRLSQAVGKAGKLSKRLSDETHDSAARSPEKGASGMTSEVDGEALSFQSAASCSS